MLAPILLRGGAPRRDLPVLAWEVEPRTLPVKGAESTAAALMLYRALPLDSGVFVIRTEVLPDEMARADEVRRTLDSQVRTIALYEGPLDFPRWAAAHGWSPVESEPSPPLSAEVVRAACERGDMEGCADVGFHAVFVSKDYGEGRRYLARACEGKVARGCFGLAGMHANGMGGPVDRPAAIRLLGRACELGFPPACTMRDQMVGADPKGP